MELGDRTASGERRSPALEPHRWTGESPQKHTFSGAEVAEEEQMTRLSWTGLRSRSGRPRPLLPAHDRITASPVIYDTMNGTVFRTYIEQFLVATLAPGELVIMDNLPSHKVAGVRNARSRRRTVSATARRNLPKRKLSRRRRISTVSINML